MQASITGLLSAWKSGDTSSRDDLVTTLSPELHRFAEYQSHREPGNHTLQPTAPVNELDVIALDGTLNRLDALDADKARIVELRYFGGLSIEETAQTIRQ